MKFLAFILTAAAVLIGADAFATSEQAAQSATENRIAQFALHGGSGQPPPPPD